MRRIPLLAVPAILAILGAAPAQPVPGVSSAPARGAATCLRTPFVGITETSETGEIIGRSDPKDWGCAGDRGSGPSPGRSTGIGSVPPVPPPSELCLLPAFPNPTTGASRLGLTLAEPTHVSLVIYGQTRLHGPREVAPVRTLIDAQLVPGQHMVVWDGNDDAGAPVASGVYRAVLVAGPDALCGDIEILSGARR